jgi:hypothetical protein
MIYNTNQNKTVSLGAETIFDRRFARFVSAEPLGKDISRSNKVVHEKVHHDRKNTKIAYLYCIIDVANCITLKPVRNTYHPLATLCAVNFQV